MSIKRPQPTKIKAVIVPHDVIAIELADEVISSLADSNPKMIILMGPNHTANGPKIASASKGAKLSSLIGVNDELVENEHSIGNIVPLLARHLPNAEIVPIIFQKGVSFDSAKKVMEEAFSQPDAIIIASIDFSHGLLPYEEQIHRAEIEEYIRNFDSAAIMALDETYVDAPIVLAVLLESLKGCNADVIAGANTAEVSGMGVQVATGYLTIIFD